MWLCIKYALVYCQCQASAKIQRTLGLAVRFFFDLNLFNLVYFSFYVLNRVISSKKTKQNTIYMYILWVFLFALAELVTPFRQIIDFERFSLACRMKKKHTLKTVTASVVIVAAAAVSVSALCIDLQIVSKFVSKRTKRWIFIRAQ